MTLATQRAPRRSLVRALRSWRGVVDDSLTSLVPLDWPTRLAHLARMPNLVRMAVELWGRNRSPGPRRKLCLFGL